MNSLEKPLQDPMVRLGVSACWLLAASVLISSLLIRGFNLLGIFERYFFERWWNLDKAAWIAILVTLLLWVAVSILMGFEPLVWGGAAGAFFVWAVFVRNIAFELPDFLTKLVLLLDSVLALVGLALGLLTLIRSTAGTTAAEPAFRSSPGPEPSRIEPATQVDATSRQPATIAVPPPRQDPAPDPTPMQAAPELQAAGWYPDPRGETTWRWWDGSAWTDNTN